MKVVYLRYITLFKKIKYFTEDIEIDIGISSVAIFILHFANELSIFVVNYS